MREGARGGESLLKKMFNKCSPGTLSTQLLIIQLLTCGAVVQLGIYMYPILQTRSLPEYTCIVLYSNGYICTPFSKPGPFLNTHVLYRTARGIYVPQPPNQVKSSVYYTLRLKTENNVISYWIL